MNLFGFDTSAPQKPAAPGAPAAPQATPPPGAAPGQDPLLALFTALAQAMQAQSANAGGRLQLQRDSTFGQHLGAGGGNITPENPVGYAGGSPFANGFFKSSAADLSPFQRAMSQGGNAMNQTQYPGMFPGSAAPTQSNADAAFAASPPPFQLDPSTLALMGRGGRPATPAPGPLGSPKPGFGFGASAKPAKRKGSAFAF